MKKNFKKTLSVLLVALMLCSVFSVCALAAGPYRITLTGGYRSLNSTKLYGEFVDKFDAFVGVEKTVQTGDYVFMYRAGGGNASQLPVGETYYEFTYTDANSVVYTFTYTINEETGEKENQAATFYTDAAGNHKFPEHFFKMDGHGEQGRWSSSTTGNGSGQLKTDSSKKVSKNTVYGCYYTQEKYTVSFLPGADGEGAVQTQTNLTYNRKITLKGDIFTRAGYVQIGWATTENSATVEYELNAAQIPVTGDMSYYPVWQKVNYDLDYDVDSFSFGSYCVGYGSIAAQSITITNNSNADVTLKLPTDAAFTFTAEGSLKIPADGGKLVIRIQPKAGLAVNIYNSNVAFDFGITELNFTVNVKFVVRDHLFIKYASNGDATYTQNGTETAVCHNGCGEEDTREAADTMKYYSIDNNTAVGLLPEYLYHKTVNFTAYGSGMDDMEGVVGKRFRPVSWYVNDTLNGEFAEGTDYVVKYTHSDFGQFTVTIKYVEEEFVEGEWVATEVEDEKSFNYSIGPSAKDEQEVVLPNTIVGIIFGLFGYLMDLLSGLIG